MGKNNRSRRAAKAKDRQRRRAQHAARQSRDQSDGEQHSDFELDEPYVSRAETVRHLLLTAIGGVPHVDADAVERAGRALEHHPSTLVWTETEGLTLQLVTHLWDCGWQPRELIGQLERASKRAGALAAWMVAADHHPRAPESLDPIWAKQVTSLDLPKITSMNGWVARWADATRVHRDDVLETLLVMLSALGHLGPIEVLLPPPGTDPERASHIGYAPYDVDAVGDDGDGADPMLQKIRGLLLQAESTSFPEEAEAFTAKAQQLMTRHAIDAALVDAALSASARRGGGGERPIVARVPIDDPYVGPKSLLLQLIAEHNRCRSVFYPQYSFSQLVGFRTDIQLTDLLFTSLLIQAHSALLNYTRSAPAGSHTRSRRFRASFLQGYANRIGDRLAEVADKVVADAVADGDDRLLPILADRSAAVDGVADNVYDNIRKGRVGGNRDRYGLSAGSAAADDAAIDLRDSAVSNSPKPTTPISGR